MIDTFVLNKSTFD